MKFIDLFAGLGGFHIGLQKLGHECVFSSEINTNIREIYAKNFPSTKKICGHFLNNVHVCVSSLENVIALS